MDESPKIKSDTTVASAKRSLKSAGLLVAKKTERTKLATVTLPRAYLELGKAVYKDAAKRIVFADQCRKLDALLNERKKIHEDAKAKPTASTLTEKARQVASDAQDLAKTKAIDLKVFQAFASLGESAYSELGRNAGLAEVIEPIAMAVERRDLLDQEMASLEASSKGQWITPRRLVIGGGALLGLMVLAMIIPSPPLGGESGSSPNTKGSRPILSPDPCYYDWEFEHGVTHAKQLRDSFGNSPSADQMKIIRMWGNKYLDSFRRCADNMVNAVSEKREESVLAQLRMIVDKARGRLDGYQSVWGALSFGGN
jgi:hypothetical protein